MNTQLLNLFAQTFDLSPSLLVPDATLESLGVDSLAVIEFMFQVEDKFGIQIPDQGTSPSTLGEMDALFSSLLPEQGTPIHGP